jgi:two-component system sensor histidine kinase BaeS
LGLRVHLLDGQGRQVAGVPLTVAEPFRLPIELDGAVIGWLLLSPPQWFEDDLAQRFNSQHNRSLTWISVGVLALAFLLGWLFGEGLLRRIRTLARGSRQLAGGDFGTRIADHGQDELSALSEDFNRLAAALERNEELRRRAMADVSHELRTPVAVARAELDALIDGIRPCTKANLEQLQGRLLALVRLLDDLYDLALSDAGALDYRFSPLDLGETVQVAVAQMEGAFARKGIALQLECDDELPMDGDRGRLRQVLDNLLGNSLRYTDPKGVTRVVARRAGAWIRVSVEDTAPGVEPEALERLFDRFYRVETSRSRAKGGAGLGLAICRNIVEAHRGSIQARAADAGGLAVEIRLPASDG